MPSDQPDPQLEATARLFAGDLEKFFHRYVLHNARLYSADTDLTSAQIEFLLDKVGRFATRFAILRFSRFANALEDERNREKVARACVERLSPLADELFALVDDPERAETWTEEFERWLVNELQRIPDGKIVRTSSSGSGKTEQQAVDQRTLQIGDRVVSRQPPAKREEVESRAQRSRSPREVDPRKGMIAKIKSQGEHRAERIAALMDEAIEKLPPNVHTLDPLDDWKKDAPSETRTWKEFLDLPVTHGRVRNYINGVPPLPSEISKKAN